MIVTEPDQNWDPIKTIYVYFSVKQKSEETLFKVFFFHFNRANVFRYKTMYSFIVQTVTIHYMQFTFSLSL